MEQKYVQDLDNDRQNMVRKGAAVVALGTPFVAGAIGILGNAIGVDFLGKVAASILTLWVIIVACFIFCYDP